jgi:hypothetical protein
MAKFPIVTTPVSALVFGSLTVPSTKFKKAGQDGQYEATVVLDTTEQSTQDFIAAVEKAAIAGREAEAAKGKNPAERAKILAYSLSPSFQPMNDRDTGEPIPNTVRVNAKRGSSGISVKTGKRWTADISLYDAAMKPIPKSIDIGWGSKVRLAIELAPFSMPATKLAGVSMKLIGVQVLELVNRGGKSAESLGFEATEGYVAAAEAIAAKVPSTEGDDFLESGTGGEDTGEDFN